MEIEKLYRQKRYSSKLEIKFFCQKESHEKLIKKYIKNKSLKYGKGGLKEKKRGKESPNNKDYSLSLSTQNMGQRQKHHSKSRNSKEEMYEKENSERKKL